MNGKLSMVSFRRLVVRGRCLFGSFECSYVHVFLFNAYRSLKVAVPATTNPSWKWIFPIHDHIVGILGTCRGSQIFPLVVQAIAVFVVNTGGRLVGNHFPDHKVDEITNPSYFDYPICLPETCSHDKPCFATRPLRIPPQARPLGRSCWSFNKMMNRSFSPRQASCLRVIQEALAQVCLIWQDTFGHWFHSYGTESKDGIGCDGPVSSESYGIFVGYRQACGST